MRDAKGVVASIAYIPGAGAGMTEGFENVVKALCCSTTVSGDK